MTAWKIGGVLLCVMLGAGRPGLAQTPSSPRVFVDGAMLADRDNWASLYGPDAGTAGRAAVGVHFSDRNSLRFEVDVPRRRVADRTSSSPVWCARSADCLGGEGWVPARTTSHGEARTVSYSFLYARHLPEIGRVQVGLLAGGSVEERDARSSGSFDELGPDGRVVRHSSYDDGHTNYWPAAVLGVDAEVRLTSHLGVTPQFRFHTLPYPCVSIVRPGIALRWRF
jgi:hypothetical protein